MSKVYEVITDRIVALLNSGTVPWRKPWIGGAAKNLVSGKEYRGINAFLLGAASYSSAYWLTFNQARERGGSVKKGERGWPVLFFRMFEKEGKNGREERIPMARYYTCFNAEQCEGLEVPTMAARAPVDPIEACERIVAAYPAPPTVREGEARAYYQPSADVINMPARSLFESSEGYYATLFHEITHSTGHASRLARKGVVDPISFGSHAYSREELIAEMGASFLCGEAGISPATLDQSAAYIANWLKRLKDDQKLVIEAASAAQKAADLILNRRAASGSGDKSEPAEAVLNQATGAARTRAA